MIFWVLYFFKLPLSYSLANFFKIIQDLKNSSINHKSSQNVKKENVSYWEFIEIKSASFLVFLLIWFSFFLFPHTCWSDPFYLCAWRGIRYCSDRMSTPISRPTLDSTIVVSFQTKIFIKLVIVTRTSRSEVIRSFPSLWLNFHLSKTVGPKPVWTLPYPSISAGADPSANLVWYLTSKITFKNGLFPVLSSFEVAVFPFLRLLWTFRLCCTIYFLCEASLFDFLRVKWLYSFGCCHLFLKCSTTHMMFSLGWVVSNDLSL